MTSWTQWTKPHSLQPSRTNINWKDLPQWWSRISLRTTSTKWDYNSSNSNNNLNSCSNRWENLSQCSRYKTKLSSYNSSNSRSFPLHSRGFNLRILTTPSRRQLLRIIQWTIDRVPRVASILRITCRLLKLDNSSNSSNNLKWDHRLDNNHSSSNSRILSRKDQWTVEFLSLRWITWWVKATIQTPTLRLVD